MNSHAQFPSEIDPHRGMYVDKFFKTRVNNSSIIDPAFSIIAVDQDHDGIYEKEDALLRYAAENHITYLAIYDMHRILGRNYMAWDEAQKRFVNMEEHLCRFIKKAKTKYGITQIGAIGGSENFFDSLGTYLDRYPVTNPYRLSNKIKESTLFDPSLEIVEKSFLPGDPQSKNAEALKFCLRAMDFNSNNKCQADIDVLNVEYEFWQACATDFPNFVSILNSMHSLKEMYNLDHPDNPVFTEVYVAALIYCQGNFGMQAVVQTMDGCTNCSPCAGCMNPHPRMIDRVLYAWFSANPGTLALWEQNLFEDATTGDSTDFHPLLYSECFRTGGTADFIGTWFPASKSHNIFTADEAYYDSWINNSAVQFGTPKQNNVQPGGSHWFTAMHMVGHLDHPQILQNTGPYCVTSGEAEITFQYLGPIEPGIAYQFWVTRDTDGSIVYPAMGGHYFGISGAYRSATGIQSQKKSIDFSDTLLFPKCNLPAGNYTAHLLLTYENGTGQHYLCNNEVHVDTKPRITVVGQKEFCEGNYTYLHVGNGTGTFNWFRNNKPIAVNSSDLLVMEDGDYFCTINGGSLCNGNTDTVHIHVLQNPPVGVNAICNGDGTATIRANLYPSTSTTVNGTGGLLYRWNTGDTTEQITLTPPTSNTVYRVNVSDPYSGCVRTGQLTLRSPLLQNYLAGISVNAVPSSSCSNDGRLTAFISPGGSGPNNYIWSNGETTASISNLSPGTYTVAMNVWSNGCTAYKSIVLGTPPTNSPQVNAVVTPTSCGNTSDGSIHLSITGGNAPFTFEWLLIPDDSIHSPITQDQVSLLPGNYSVIIKDAGGCEFMESYVITSSNSIPVIQSISTTPVVGCSSNSNGSATVTAAGGLQPYSYLWSDDANQVTVTASNIKAGIIKVEVTDANGCSISGFASVASNELPVTIEMLDSSLSKISCIGPQDGAIYLNIRGGHEPYSASSGWLTDSNFAMMSSLSPGAYPIEITDGNGCLHQDTFTIFGFDSISIFTTKQATSCIGCQDGSFGISIMGGEFPYQVTCQPNNGNITGNTILNLSGGIYTLCISDKNGCLACLEDTIHETPTRISELSISDIINVYPNPFLEFTQIKFSNHKLEQARIAIYDVNGREISRKSLLSDQVITLHKNELSPGIYLLRLFDHNEIAVDGLLKLIVF